MPKLIDVVKKYDALTDSPIAIAYRKLDDIFPNSKFILTTRSLDSWMESCRNYRHFRILLKGDYERVRKILYGYNGFHETKFKLAYVKHHRQVRRYFENRNDLLILDITKGRKWEKLCSFLGKEIPNTLFPHLNKGK